MANGMHIVKNVWINSSILDNTKMPVLAGFLKELLMVLGELPLQELVPTWSLRHVFGGLSELISWKLNTQSKFRAKTMKLHDSSTDFEDKLQNQPVTKQGAQTDNDDYSQAAKPSTLRGKKKQNHLL